ncbi:uro-adherence factor A [Pseudorasbora parva]|uniref:uro-adherence factor A n=1 Tax=Pseudorasbora parva TaxID=51549 RepID=UPI00351EFEE6
MMFCRAAWQRLAPLARKTLTPLSSNAVFPTRQMSFGLPASGTNMAYMVIGGSSLTAALVYVYKTINSDSARYNERIAQLEARPKIGTVASIASVAEAAAIVEATVAENTIIVEAAAAEPVMIDAEAEETPEHVDAAMEVEAETAIVQSVAADAEEPTTPVVEDVAIEAVAPIAETTGEASSVEATDLVAVIPMSDLMSTVKILAGSTVEIAAASVGDHHLVAAVRLAEENSSVETLNGLEEADVEEPMIGRSDLKTREGEQEQLPSALQAVEETTIEVADDHVKSEADSPVEAEVYAESPASSEEASVTEMENILELEESVSPVVMFSEDDIISRPAEVTSETVKSVGQKIEEDNTLFKEASVTEMENILELEESVSPVVMFSEDDIISGPAEATSETVKSVGQKIEEDNALFKEASVTEMEIILELDESMRPVVMLSEDDTISGPAEAMSEIVKAVDQKIEEDKVLCHKHEAAATETEHSDLTAPPADQEEALQTTTEPADEVVAEIRLDDVGEAKPVMASEEAVESGDVTMTMAQA